MNERLKALREHEGLSRAAFGERLGVSGDVINNFERGRVEIKEPFIKLICVEFNINEDWFRTGEGEMFIKRTRLQIITDFVGDSINEPDSFKTRFLEGLARLDVHDWEDIERIMTKLAAKSTRDEP